MAEKKMKIVLTGGGTGGHVFPLIAVAREIKRIMPHQTELIFVGPKDEWVDLYLSQEEVRIKPILAGKLRRYITPVSVLLNILDAFKFVIGTVQAFFTIFFINPDLIFSKGGYGSLPVALVGRFMQVPIFNHESDSCPGMVNRITSRLSLQTFVSFPRTEYIDPRKIFVVGNPIRRELFNGSAKQSKEVFNLTGEKPILFVYPGSQGSQRINDLILLVLPALLQTFEVIHQCGSKNHEQVKQEAEVVMEPEQKKYYHLLPFLNEKEAREAYFAADIVISRAGSANIFEAAALHKVLILIPLPESAQDHQRSNAYRLQERGAAVVLEEENITPQFFLEKLHFLITHEKEMERMRSSIARFAKPKAAKVIAHYILEYLLI